jgi:hypothetical protein
MSYRLGAFLALGAAVACSSGSGSGEGVDAGRDVGFEPQSTQRTFDDRGAVCLSPGEDANISVSVRFRACLSSSCDHADSATCTAELEHDRLVVSSQLTVTSQTNRVCTADCGSGVRVACGVVQPRSAGIRVVHGADESDTLSLPLREDTWLAEEIRAGACSNPWEMYFGEQ